MCKPFIRNHHYNLIKKQAGLLQHACSTVSDPKVVESVRYGVLAKIAEAFPDASDAQMRKLEKLAELNSAAEFQAYLKALEPDVLEFAETTERQLKKLFPKIKKLKTPALTGIDRSFLTYLGWTDIAANKMYLVYELHGRLVGIEGRFTPVGRKGVCFLCSKHEEIALFSATTKWKPAGASPDYYKAIGNYLCANSRACNRNITDVAALEKFMQDVLGQRQ
ncbi:FusB/FusC family EF-G-binding protein [Paenibacillus humicola]|uniref:FusB/FusC family EF-G-binding protein n=1 Tax=Paenibacillus humicola TaxID=3110540 RepID=UPI00237C4BE5|nr:FusB/FusC family EF-G-binding protein [Paenibacillus humicola]